MLSGTAAGFNLRSPNVWGTAWGVNNVIEANRAGWMYAPGQGSTQASSFYGTSVTAPTKATLSANTNGNIVTVDVANAPAEAQVLVLASSMPSAVTINQATVSQAQSLAALQGMSSGWIFTTGPFGGVLLKLAPASGAAHVSMTMTAPTNATTTGVTASPNASTYGQAVTFASTVSGGTGAAGNVQFVIDGVNSGVPVAVAGGQASFTYAALAAGSHSIAAIYSGDTANLGSTSMMVTQVVNIAATTTALASDGTTVVSPVAPGGGIPTGTVQFMNGASNVGTPVPLVAGQATLASGALSPGLYTLTAAYSGDANFSASAATAQVTVLYPVSGIFGDVNGDGVVNCQDLSIAGSIVGKRTGQPGFQPTADLDHNGVIDIRDISAISRLLPAGTHC